MSSKQQILNSIRQGAPAKFERPVLDAAWITYADRRRQFHETLEGVGGTAVDATNTQAVNESLRHLPAYSAARRIVSLVPDIGEPTVDLNDLDDPHALADLDLAILPGELAVAENAAVWVTDHAVRHRAVYFIARHMVLVVPAGAIVDTMHQAYDRLEFGEPGFGTFVSGPSKTADIEQSLVIGAHGAKSLVVFLLDSA